MIDIHTHILPGLDDGAESLEEALAMARMAAADGIETLFATPHVIPGSYGSSSEGILKAAGELQTFLEENDISIRILPGAEYYIGPELPEMCAGGKALFLNNKKKYLLVEFPALQVPPYTEQVFYDLRLQGIIPVIAHPERNREFAGKPVLLYNLISKGALVQITSGSLTGLFGKSVSQTAREFVSRGWAHFIASDAHSSRGRAPVLGSAFKAASSIIGEEAAKSLVYENPLRVVDGEDVLTGTIREPESPRGIKKLFFFKGR